MTTPAAHLTTRQLWVLLGVADGRIHQDRIYAEFAPFELDGQPISWTITGLALRGLVRFDRLTHRVHLSRRGITTLQLPAPSPAPPTPRMTTMAEPTPTQPNRAEPTTAASGPQAQRPSATRHGQGSAEELANHPTGAGAASDGPDPRPTGNARRDDQTLIDELAYAYEGTFDNDTITEAVTGARRSLEASATLTTYLPVLIARRARQQLLDRALANGRTATAVPEVLFICVHNAGRSQMAAALSEHLTGGRIHARSAGSSPAQQIHPVVIQALAERGITLTQSQPKPLTDDVVRASDVIVTMGCGDDCPFYPGKRYLTWDIPDPHNQPIEAVRHILDLIQSRVTDLLHELRLPA